MISLNPSVRIQAKPMQFRPHASMGILIGGGSILLDLVSKVNTEHEQFSRKYHGGMSFGFNSSLGIEHSLNPKTSLTFDIVLQSTSYGPKKMNTVLWEINGDNVLEEKKKYETDYIFKDNYTKDRGSDLEDNQPRIRSRKYYPFGSIGFCFGVRYILTKTK